MTDTQTRPALDVARIRAEEFPFLGDAIYLNAASVGPLPERARRAVDAANLQRARVHEMEDPDFVRPLSRAREAAARLVGASPEEIALGWNTTYGITLAALSLPLEAGSTIVVSEGEFPANVYPWMARGDSRVETVPGAALGRPDEERVMERLDRGDVSVFALSHVQFASGYRSDLERWGRFCRERGIFFVVDAIQSVGVVPVDVRAAEIDVLATGGHKWLCSPFGTGFAYVRADLAARMEPRIAGWTSMAACRDFNDLLDYRWEFRPGTRKFEVATLPLQDFAGFAEAAGLLLEVGPERIEEHLRDVLEPLVVWLGDREEVEVYTDLDPARRAGIVAFRPPSPEAVFARLRAAGVGCVLREGAIRLAPHLYNTRDEMERVVALLEESRSRRWS